MQDLRINEIFYSLQGEGARAGTPVIFIRLAGCNLCCKFCDTKFEKFKLLSINELIAHIKFYLPCKSIVWTGGEPCLQLNQGHIGVLKSHGYHQAIETNGTQAIPEGLDYISISPKGRIHESIKRANELRFVVTNIEHKPIVSPPDIQYDHLYISPAFDGNTLNRTLLNHCINLCKENPSWKLSVQQHKTWKIQ